MCSRQAVVFAVVLAGLLLPGHRLIAQEEGHVANSSAPTIVTGEAFSAVTYMRTVRVQPDGSFLTLSQNHRIQIARDVDGRIFMAGADRAGDHCDLPSLGKLPPCDMWKIMLFDPVTGVMWHWGEGEIADQAQLALMDLHEDQIADVTRQTSLLASLPSDSSEPNVKFQNLGEKDIEGVRASGIRTTLEQKDQDGKVRLKIHEVWQSDKMRLVLMVIDGDPAGEETIYGLRKILLAPDISLFKPPTGRIVRHWKDSYKYAANDISDLEENWPLKSGLQ
jgi:hypothetical protein